MQSPTIIGVTGRKFNGKDSVADYLHTKYGFHKISFAEPLKEICKTLFGFSDEQLHGSLKETVDPRWGVSPRLVMQFIGTELFRNNMGTVIPNLGENFWIKCAIEKIYYILERDPKARFVISDIRFINEIEYFRNFTFNGNPVSFYCIRVVRPSININESSLHSSETMIDTLPVDKTIINDKSISDLYDQIDCMYL